MGYNEWILSEKYNAITVNSPKPSVFVKEMAVAVFGIETLKNSSVTGKLANSNKKKIMENVSPYPALDTKKRMAIKSKLIEIFFEKAR